MTSDNVLVETSKFLSYILRHAPESIGVTLDREGWVDVDTLIAAASSSGRQLTTELIAQVVAQSDKKRFSLTPDGRLIRAAQGHSTKSVAIAYVPLEPPAILYHGTAMRFLDAILKAGINPQSRQYVHLSSQVETATDVGQRHGKPIVLRIDAGAMHNQGYQFYRADNGVWLTERVPGEFLWRVYDSSGERDL